MLYVFQLYPFIEFCLHILIAGLTEKSEHILLISLNSGLIKGVNTKKIAGHCAGEFEEINHISKRGREIFSRPLSTLRIPVRSSLFPTILRT